MSNPWALKNPRASATRKGNSLFHARPVKTTRRFFFSWEFAGAGAYAQAAHSNPKHIHQVTMAVRFLIELLLQLSFGAEFLLGNFQDPVVDHAIDREVLIDEAGANVFIEHLLNARDGDRQVRRQAW